MQYLPETQITEFQPASSDALAQYISEQRSHLTFFPWVLGTAIFLTLVALGSFWPLAIVTIATRVAACIYIFQFDQQRTHVALNYELDAAETQNHQQLCSGAQALASAARLQRVEARQMHGDWKHQAGTTTALQLAPASILPPGSLPWLQTNIPVWAIQWRQGHLTLVFLPDRLLVEQGRRAAALLYPQVEATIALGRFVEKGPIPRDARVVGYNWQYPNKDGGPDRRFKNNRQWPVLEVAYIGLQSQSGLNLLLQASNRQGAEFFAHNLRAYKPLVCAEPPLLH